MAHLFQVGAGSGGMPVLDLVCRDERITQVTLVEPDIYKPHNVVRHLFPPRAVGRPKAELARDWLRERRPDLDVRLFVCPLQDEQQRDSIESAARSADLGICAADNEPTKFYFDALMRRHGKPWTLGEVLSGGIGGFVHDFVPEGPCYGCVASHLKRTIAVDQPPPPDYSQPGGAVHEVTIPASKASIAVIAGLHAQISLHRLGQPRASASLFTSLLFTLETVPGVFDEAFRPYRFRIARSADCLICRPGLGASPTAGEELDVALDQALKRLGDA